MNIAWLVSADKPICSLLFRVECSYKATCFQPLRWNLQLWSLDCHRAEHVCLVWTMGETPTLLLSEHLRWLTGCHDKCSVSHSSSPPHHSMAEGNKAKLWGHLPKVAESKSAFFLTSRLTLLFRAFPCFCLSNFADGTKHADFLFIYFF